jgi:hypothetical protein
VYKVILFNNLVTIRCPQVVVTVGPPTTFETFFITVGPPVKKTKFGTAASQAIDKESDHVGSDLDGMKSLFNATLSK